MFMEMLEKPHEQLRMKLELFSGTVPSTSGCYGYYNEANGTWVLLGGAKLNGSEPAVEISVHRRIDNNTPVGCGAEARTLSRETFTDLDRAFLWVLNLLAEHHPDLWRMMQARMLAYANMANGIHFGLCCAETGSIRNAPYEDGARTLAHLKKLVEPFRHFEPHKGYYPTIPVPMQVQAREMA